MNNQEIKEKKSIGDMIGELVLGGIVISILLLIGYTYGEIYGKMEGMKLIQKEAVEKGVAEYNSTNGIWQWKEIK